MVSSNILVIGGGSKIAKRFLTQLESDGCTVYKTFRHANQDAHTFSVDLSNKDSLRTFTKEVSGIAFDSVVFFSSTYTSDAVGLNELLDQYCKDFQCNALSLAYICKNIRLNPSSQVIAFGDSGISHPKRDFSSYSLSKLALEDIIKILAVELAPHTTVNAIRLGPTFSTNSSSTAYYDRYLVQKTIAEPIEGLIVLLNFMINNKQLNMTGSLIDYDGGAYLSRNTGQQA
ncbi:MAG TPA: SDR family oxidoreductase [Candidatus Chromulinivoraceae bacterium]|nr:SDR family oxidoreductase [Candidatus Chromulinivoraceae bacterium]